MNRIARILCFCLVAWRYGSSQACEIDFHTEAASLMMLSGQGASVLCDASACEPEISHDALPGEMNELTVLWKNPAGVEVTRTPGQLFSVRYRSGPMSRLMVMEAAGDVEGEYLCSVMRNGVVLQERGIQLIVLDAIGSSRATPAPTRRPRPRGRRRGDMDPEEEEFGVLPNFRPVRSVSSHNSDTSLISKLHEIAKHNVESTQDFHITKQVQAMSGNNPVGKASAVEKRKPWRSGSYFIDLFSFGQNAESSLDDEVNHSVEPTESSLAHVLHKREAVTNISPTPDATTEEPEPSTTSTENSTEESITTEQIEITNSSQTSQDTRTLTIILVSEESTYTVATEPPSTTQVTTPSSAPTSTPSEDLITTTPAASTTQYNGAAQGGRTTTPRGGSSSRPTWPEREESFFGRHGVAAFAITLAIAVLLLYALLMVIFMPKILACRSKSAKINGHPEKAAMYRKKASGIEDEAPMTLLSESSHHPDIQVDEETVQSGQSENKSFHLKDDDGEGADTMAAAVSTFLLRQNSQRKADEEEQRATARKLSSDKTAAEGDDPIKPGEEITLTPEEVKLEEQPAADPSLPRPPAETAHEQNEQAVGTGSGSASPANGDLPPPPSETRTE